MKLRKSAEEMFFLVFPPAEIHFIFIVVAIMRVFYCLHVTNLKSRRFPEKTFDIITCTVKIFYKLLMIIYPNWKTKENYKILLTLPIDEWRNSWYHFKLPSCHFTQIFKNCANCSSLHIFRIWFLWLLFSFDPISFVS